jgi:Fic family protein
LEYKAFIPSKPPTPPIEITNDILEMTVKANTAITKLNRLGGSNRNLFLSTCVRKEALMSSQIEGTQTSFKE